MIILKGLKFKQNGKTLYISVVKGAELENWVRRGYLDVDQYTPDRPDGYQRVLEDKRVRQIVEFLTGRERVFPLMPQCIVLNVREEDFKVGWKPKINPFGEIEIPTGAILWEVDGQHRIGGLLEAIKEKPSLRKYAFPVVVTELERPAEAIQFIVINTRQKRVPTGLTLRALARRHRQQYAQAVILLERRGQKWVPDAIEIMDKLTKDTQSIWYNRVRPIGRKGRSREFLVPELAFFMSFEHLIGRGRALEGKEVKYVKDFLSAFWGALERKYSKACGTDSAHEYFLMKGPGVVPMHLIAGLVYHLTNVLEGNPLKRVNVEKIFNRMNLKESFWRGGSSFHGIRGPLYGPGGYRRLADEVLTEALIPRYKLNREFCEKRVKKGSPEEKLLKRAIDQIAPLRLYKLFRPSIVRQEVPAGAGGAYVLFSARRNQFYTGGVERGDLRDRILQHASEDYDLFNFGFAKTPKEALILECTLYHLFKKTKLKTKRHPRKHCPYCYF